MPGDRMGAGRSPRQLHRARRGRRHRRNAASGADARDQKAIHGSIPLQRFATKDEIADLALFLSTDAARFITGAIVVCDGGQSLAGLGVNMMAALRAPT